MKKTIKELRWDTGLHQAEFGKRMGGIPLRTIQNWENGVRTPPEWVVELIAFRVENDKNLLTEEEKLQREAARHDLLNVWNFYKAMEKRSPRKKKTDTHITDEVKPTNVRENSEISKLREIAENAPSSIREKLLLEVELFERKYNAIMDQRDADLPRVKSDKINK